jgi:uncharacterized protein (TIGR00725 family)
VQNRRTVIGVIGPGDGALPRDLEAAHRMGGLIAAEGWVTLTGGWNAGVMDAASRGAQEAGGLTVGLLPSRDTEGASPAVELAIPTGLGEARNNLVVLASDALVCCGMSPGTASEAALAIRAAKPLILVAPLPATRTFFGSFRQAAPIDVADADAAIVALRRIIQAR